MTAVTPRAERRCNASRLTSTPIRLSFAGYDVDWITNTSSPRTFSWISTNTSMSAKRRIEARVRGSFSVAATASASGRLLLQATIFIPLGCQGGSSGRPFDAGVLAFYQRPLGLSMNRLVRIGGALGRRPAVVRLVAGLAGGGVVH